MTWSFAGAPPDSVSVNVSWVAEPTDWGLTVHGGDGTSAPAATTSWSFQPAKGVNAVSLRAVKDGVSGPVTTVYVTR